jgi:hypothetical protein
MAQAIASPVKQETPARTPRKPAPLIVLSTAELAPCTCPEYCDRDHDRD